MKLILSIFIITGLMMGFANMSAHADGIEIEEGGNLHINGGTLDMTCQLMVIKDGDSLTFTDGNINHSGEILIEPGGNFNRTGGILTSCYGFLPSIFQLLLLN